MFGLKIGNKIVSVITQNTYSKSKSSVFHDEAQLYLLLAWNFLIREKRKKKKKELDSKTAC